MSLVVALLIGLNPTPLADLPFEYEPGRIWLKGTLNDKPMRTMLDSGAGGIIMTEEAAARAGGTKGEAFWANTIGGPTKAWWASGMMFGLEGAPIQISVTAIVSSSRMPDVAAGMPLFLLGVTVDYVKRRVRIYSPGTYVPPEDAIALPIKLKDGTPLVRMKLAMPGGRTRDVVALVDTGSPVGIEVTRRFARREGLDRRYAHIPPTDQPGGIGGPTRARVVPKVEAEFGEVKVIVTANVDTTEEGSAGRNAAYDVLVGDELLKHFDLGFDYLRSKLWIKPNGLK